MEPERVSSLRNYLSLYGDSIHRGENKLHAVLNNEITDRKWLRMRQKEYNIMFATFDRTSADIKHEK